MARRALAHRAARLRRSFSSPGGLSPGPAELGGGGLLLERDDPPTPPRSARTADSLRARDLRDYFFEATTSSGTARSRGSSHGGSRGSRGSRGGGGGGVTRSSVSRSLSSLLSSDEEGEDGAAEAGEAEVVSRLRSTHVDPAAAVLGPGRAPQSQVTRMVPRAEHRRALEAAEARVAAWQRRAQAAEAAAAAAAEAAQVARRRAEAAEVRTASAKEVLGKETDRLRRQRNEAIEDLIGAQADMKGQEAALRDADQYIKYLKKKLLETELQAAKAGAAAAAAGMRRRGSVTRTTGTVFDSGRIKEEIRRTLKEAAKLGEKEKKAKVRSLMMKWHPDKNPVLRDMATELTKIINECNAELQ